MVTERSLEAQKRGYVERLRLNKGLSKNLYWRLPVDDVGHENFVPVGRGGRSSVLCGKWLSFLFCGRTDLHKGVVVGGRDYTDKVVVRHRHLWCNRSSCCVCFARGWSSRLARSIEGRCDEGVSRGFGKVEHCFVSAPPEDYGLSEDVLRERCRLAMLDRGVIGGCMIFHGYRPNEDRNLLRWSPHYHCLGFIRGGFDVCRKCVKRGRDRCVDCGGFKGREVRGFAKDRYFVSCLNERKTVFGTAYYQLNHATLRVGVKRFQVVTWFGLLGYRMMKSEKVKPVVPCPACHSGMERAFHVGSKRISKDVGDEGYASLFLDDEFDDAGDPNYIASGGGRYSQE